MIFSWPESGSFLAKAVAMIVVSAVPLRISAFAQAPPLQPCGVSDASLRSPTADDARFIADSLIGLRSGCGPCLCDVDGNGRVDLQDAMVVLQRANGIDIELKCPDCSCHAVSEFADIRASDEVTMADLDDDGYSDIVWSTGFGDVYTKRGLGRGAFDAARVSPRRVGRFVFLLREIDVTNDGLTDLVVGASRRQDDSPSQIRVYRGRRSGGYRRPRRSEQPVSSRAVFVDLDGDGNLDVIGPAWSYGTGRQYVLRGDGRGRFNEVAQPNLPQRVESIHATSLDPDGRSDLLVATEHRITAHRGGPGLVFGSGELVLETGDRDSLAHVRIGDFTDDGIADIVYSIWRERHLNLLAGRVDGSFADAEPIHFGGRLQYFDVVDLNRDGRSDIVATLDSQALEVRVSSDEWGFGSARRYELHRHARRFFVLDANDDDIPDVLIDGDWTLLTGVGDGTFHQPTRSRAMQDIADLAFADVDHDGSLDVLSNEFASTSSYQGDGRGQFSPRNPHSVGGGPGHLSVSDLDHDGQFDMVATRLLTQTQAADAFFPGQRAQGQARTAGPPQWYAAMFFGKGNGRFENQGFVENISASDLVFGDVDADGDSDLVGFDFFSKQIHIWRSSGDTFVASGSISTSTTDNGRLQVLDADGDDRDDVLFHRGNAHPSLLFLSRTNGRLTEPRELAARISPRQAVSGDLDRDGIRDLLFTSVWARSAEILFGLRPGKFSRQATSVMLERVRSPKLADFDRDGFLDLVAITVTTSPRVVLWPGHGGSSFGPPIYLATRFTPERLELADVDGNGFLDVVSVDSAREGDWELTYFSNPGFCVIPGASMPMLSTGGGD